MSVGHSFLFTAFPPGVCRQR